MQVSACREAGRNLVYVFCSTWNINSSRCESVTLTTYGLHFSLVNQRQLAKGIFSSHELLASPKSAHAEFATTINVTKISVQTWTSFPRNAEYTKHGSGTVPPTNMR